ncbi:maltotransferase domain-containing protein [Streptomyces sp. NPDC003697]
MIQDLSPSVGDGTLASKAVVGEYIPISATIWREGHESVSAAVVWRHREGDAPSTSTPMVLADEGTDRWSATVVADRAGLWAYRVDAWHDPWLTWRRTVGAKLDAGQDAEEMANDLEAGARLLERHVRRAAAGDRPRLQDAVRALRDDRLPVAARTAPALHEEVTQITAHNPLRELLTRGPVRTVRVERPLALAGAWYELFPRSTGGHHLDGTPRHGTFASTTAHLPRIAGMGFDVVYLPPVHPVGTTHRKGPNNALTAGPTDVGSPWAIGSPAGGHDAVHPDLGTLADFDALVANARGLGLEIALDLALQCSPDHPWVREHPEWFTTRPDGSIAHAENPPKSYEDILPLNFDNDPEGLYAEVLRIVLHWIDHGVTVFRVDNPHTKPARFWQWLIDQVKCRHPETVFLAEAFTRPAVLKGLADIGFSQSYTYFTWRTGKQELTDYLTELSAGVDRLRPNFFVNTPDILPAHLQTGLPASFALRAALAATLSPTWGLYAGFELLEHQVLREGTEDYLDSEKYQLRPRDFDGAPLTPWITELNRLRRAHPALRQLRSLRFLDIDSDDLLAFLKHDAASGDTVLCVITLDPERPAEGFLTLPPDLPGAGPDGDIPAQDALTREPALLTSGTVKLDPAESVLRIHTWTSGE